MKKNRTDSTESKQSEFMKNIAVDNRLPFLYHICFLLFLVVGFGLYSVWVKQDLWYDLYNYHFYNGWAFLNGKTFDHFFVAGVRTFFNPMLDAFTYLMVSQLNHMPDLIYAINGALTGVLYFVFFYFLRLFLPFKTIGEKCFFFGIFAFSVLGYAVVRQIGTTTHEITISILILSGLYFIIKETMITCREKNVLLILGGFLIGLAFGLKLTCFPIVCGAGVMVLFLAPHFHKPVKVCALIALGGLIGFLITGGYWMYQVYQYTGNPIFPMLNNWFESPLAPIENVRDNRYLPQTVWQMLFYPFYWLGDPLKVSEVSAIHVQFLLIYTVEFLMLCLWAFGVIKNRIHKGLILFWVVGYTIWMFLFSIMRYAILLELTGGLIVGLMLFYLFSYRKALVVGTVLGILAICVVPFLYYEWRPIGRESKNYMPLYQMKVDDDTVVVLNQTLVSYFVPKIQTNNPVLGFNKSELDLLELPCDEKTIHQYQKILENKKVLFLGFRTNTSSIQGALIQYVPAGWILNFILVGGYIDENGIYHGVEQNPKNQVITPDGRINKNLLWK